MRRAASRMADNLGPVRLLDVQYIQCVASELASNLGVVRSQAAPMPTMCRIKNGKQSWNRSLTNCCVPTMCPMEMGSNREHDRPLAAECIQCVAARRASSLQSVRSLAAQCLRCVASDIPSNLETVHSLAAQCTQCVASKMASTNAYNALHQEWPAISELFTRYLAYDYNVSHQEWQPILEPSAH